jgi:dihydropteroate synthase
MASSPDFPLNNSPDNQTVRARAGGDQTGGAQTGGAQTVGAQTGGGQIVRPHTVGYQPSAPILGDAKDRCRVMGIVNVTPDSFSDGGLWNSTEAAVQHGLQLWRQGADVVDIGGESTRPGAARISEYVELSRVLPVVEALAGHGVIVSIDTTRASVARACVVAGAWMINDVSGGVSDPTMLSVIAELAVPCVLMHWRAPSATMNVNANYTEVVADVRRELQMRVDAALAQGVRPDHIVLDPGLGFAKRSEHNWELLRRLDEVQSLGFPLLIGASRKRFLGECLADTNGVSRSANERDVATAAITALVAAKRVWGVRVHDVAMNLDAIRIACKTL